MAVLHAVVSEANRRMLNLVKDWLRLPRTSGSVVEDSLDAFGSESTEAPASPDIPHLLRTWPIDWRLVGVAAAILVIGVSAYLFRGRLPFMGVEASSASLTIESVPSGAEVLVEGVWQGRTPLTLSVAPGEHRFELLHRGRRKPLVAVARAGAAVVHHVDFETVAASKKASLSITTEPAKLRVLVDGAARGMSPLIVEDIEPGAHEVKVVGSTGTFSRTVDVGAGESAAVIVSASAPAAAGPAAGWLRVSSPVVLQVVEGKDVIGTTASSKIMLPAGRHQLVLASDAIGFSTKRVVQVNAGSTVAISVDLPTAPLSINAVPWAEVWLDGVRIGATPIGNRPVRLGPHELVFRHPDFGERRQSVTVSLTTRARVSVDMRQPGS